MKKLLLFVAVATFTTGALVSCGKTTKGKLDAEWTIDSMEDIYSHANSNTTNVFKIQGGIISESTTSGGSTSTESGTINEAKWTIAKDGTWKRVVSYKFIQANTNVTRVITVNETGNWDFFSGIGELKKNERIVFNTLKRTETIVTTSGSSATDVNTLTYNDGEKSEIYVVTESKKGSLALEFKGSRSLVNTSGSTTTTSTITATTTYSLSSSK